MASDSDPFRSRRQRAMKNLPPLEEVLRGSVFVRSLRCGKPGCHCASGEGHRVAYLSVTHPGGRTEQISLPADLVPTAEQWLSNYKAWWRAIEEMSAINRDMLRQRRRPAKPPPRRKKPKRRSP
jgi:hypothetical protein